MGKIIGIDLGTMNSCVAIMERGEPVVIPNAEGSRTTPSMVAFNDKGERLVGQVAKRQVETNPRNTFYAIKRLIGRKFDVDEVQKSKDLYAFKIVASENGDAWVASGEKTLSPPEISGMVLSTMKETAEDYLGQKISKAVITVPAYFDDTQRQATKDAGKIAGLEVERIINEPTAAALAYGLNQESAGTVAVFDLGGGTFDISILEIDGDVFNVKATNGDTFLGGEDFDQEIINFLADAFSKENDIDLRQDQMALQRLKEASEKAKHELSTSLETDINLPFIAATADGPKHLNVKLTRGELEKMVGDLVARLDGPCQTAMADAGLGPDNIDELILVGGMTRMPLVKQKAETIFGQEAASGVNPDEVVAVGAAIQASVLDGEREDVLLLDVTPLSLGIETEGGVFTKLIEKNTTIPTRKAEIFSTTLDNQNMVRVHVLQGERELAKDNKSLAVFELVGIPPAPRGVPQIEVTFEIDSNGIVSASAKDLATGNEQSIKVNPASGLNQDQIDTIIEEAERFSELDKEHKQLVEAKNALQALVYAAEKSYKRFASRLNPDDQTSMSALIEEGRSLMEGDDLPAIENTSEKLTAMTHRIAEVLYGGFSDD